LKSLSFLLGILQRCCAAAPVQNQSAKQKCFLEVRRSIAATKVMVLRQRNSKYNLDVLSSIGRAVKKLL
jgi:hypothetical protein